MSFSHPRIFAGCRFLSRSELAADLLERAVAVNSRAAYLWNNLASAYDRCACVFNCGLRQLTVCCIGHLCSCGWRDKARVALDQARSCLAPREETTLASWNVRFNLAAQLTQAARYLLR